MTIDVTAISIRRTQSKLFSVTLRLILKDGETELLSQDFSQYYRPGQAIGDVVRKLEDEMQDVIDNYKEEQVLLSSAALASAITTLKESLTV